MTTLSPADALPRLLHALTLHEQPASFYAALGPVLQETTGFIFVTLFLIHKGQTLRVFTTDESHYPVGVRKPMASTPWGEQVIQQKRSFLATDPQGVEAAFFDHAKIGALGCGSAIGVPIVYAGQCLGVLNLNHRAHYYDETHVRAIEALAPVLIPILLDTCRQWDAID